MPGAGVGVEGVTVRALVQGDAAAVDAMARPEIERSGYPWSVRSAVDAVLRGNDPESRGLVAVEDGRVVGFAVFGAIAGAVAAGRVQLVVTHRDARRRGIAAMLVGRAVAELAADGTRVAFAELPEDPESSSVKRLLIRCRFRIDSRVADYFRDGVDLVILRHDFSRA
jgi:ribosomal protein S18 acetylase RimI-like enzyme